MFGTRKEYLVNDKVLSPGVRHIVYPREKACLPDACFGHPEKLVTELRPERPEIKTTTPNGITPPHMRHGGGRGEACYDKHRLQWVGVLISPLLSI